jgi:hypothetical protein
MVKAVLIGVVGNRNGGMGLSLTKLWKQFYQDMMVSNGMREGLEKASRSYIPDKSVVVKRQLTWIS